MSLQKIVGAVLLVGAMTLGVPVRAAILFQDNFDADSPNSVLNFNSLLNWTVSDGTIDYIRSGDFGINCVGNTGGCLDMDGSSSDAGKITSKTTFNFLANVLYTFELMMSGNQRGGAPDTFSFGFVGFPLFNFTPAPLPFNQPFTTYSSSFTGFAFSAKIFVEGLGGDNVGSILDNVVLRDNRQAVDEPATALLVIMSVLAMGIRRRSKR